MTTEDSAKLWYVARDGKQTGPISEAEIRAIAAHGYFRVSDLVWRPGFPEWRPALMVFPGAPQAVPPAQPVAPAPVAPAAGPAPQVAAGPGRAEPGRVEPTRVEARTEPLHAVHHGHQPHPHVAAPAPQAMAQPAPQAMAQPAPQAMAQPAPQAMAQPAPQAMAQPAPQAMATPAGPSQIRAPQPPPAGAPRPHQRPFNTQPGPAVQGQPFAIRPMQPAPAGVPPGPAAAQPGAAQPLPYAYRPAQPPGGGSPHAATGRPLAITSPGPEPEPSYERPVQPRTNRMALAALALTLLAIVGGVYVAAEPALEKSGVIEQVQRTFASVMGLFGSRDAKLADIETSLQGTAHWPVLKREFPDWYGERLREAAKLSAENKTAEEITRALAERIVALRRQNASQALAASAPRLMAVASAFLENLKQLKQTSPQICYNFISQGELTPAVLDKLKTTGASPPPAIQVQVAAIFEAIAEGRRAPVVYEKPQKNDYDLLMEQLGKLGWTQDDIAVFANPRALARAEPARVCQMVQDWFVAHIAIGNADTQQRLIGETLRPVVSG